MMSSILKLFCKHICPSKTCQHRKELRGEKEEVNTPAPVPVTTPLPPPKLSTGINESHNKVELGYTFEDIYKRSLLLLEKRYKTKMTENHQSVEVRFDIDLDKSDDRRHWEYRKRIWIYRYYSSDMSTSEYFKSTETEEELETKWKNLMYKLNYFDNDKTIKEEF